jgi:hypothetical protein
MAAVFDAPVCFGAPRGVLAASGVHTQVGETVLGDDPPCCGRGAGVGDMRRQLSGRPPTHPASSPANAAIACDHSSGDADGPQRRVQ